MVSIHCRLLMLSICLATCAFPITRSSIMDFLTAPLRSWFSFGDSETPAQPADGIISGEFNEVYEHPAIYELTSPTTTTAAAHPGSGPVAIRVPQGVFMKRILRLNHTSVKDATTVLPAADEEEWSTTEEASSSPGTDATVTAIMTTDLGTATADVSTIGSTLVEQATSSLEFDSPFGTTTPQQLAPVYNAQDVFTRSPLSAMISIRNPVELSPDQTAPPPLVDWSSSAEDHIADTIRYRPQFLYAPELSEELNKYYFNKYD